MSLATALFLLLLTPLFFAPLRAVAAAHHDRADALTAAEALAADPAVPTGAAVPVDVGPAAAGRVPPAVVLDRVDVSWPGRERPALAGVTARLEPGRVAVVRGASGAGKSTLLAVVAGLTAPSSGHVRLVAEHGRAHGPAPSDIAWLGQRPAVFAATLRDNLVLGRRVAPHAVRDAVDVAGLAPVVADLPDGLDTWVGEGGYGLSTGQAHRLALARALLGDAPLWLLDEPTAHLDAATEADVVEALTAAIRGRTAVVATHSPALDRLADQTWWLERGVLTAGGDHAP
jgi:ATP-binding cassette subfamily C protein CydD